MTFACPGYNQAEPQTIGGVTYTIPGSHLDSFVDFATSAQLGTDGRIVESARVDLITGTLSNEQPAGTCAGVMQSNDAVPGVEITPGVYHWQVVRTLGSGAVAKLPRGRQTLRVAFELGGQRSYGKPRTVTVRNARKARRQTTRGDNGAWTGRADGAPEASRFRVVKGGREIRGLKVPVLLGCPNPRPNGTTFLIRSPGVIEIGRIRVAPDGRFAKVQPDREGVAEVSGRLRRGKLREGTAALVRGQCTISGGWSGRKGG